MTGIHLVTTPSVCQSFLNATAAIAPNDVWAVGETNSRIQTPFTEHFDGTEWSIVSGPNATTGHNVLNGVRALRTGSVVAVGYATDTSGSTNNLVLSN